MRVAAVAAAFLLGALPGFSLADQPPAALVMAIKGSTTPAMQPMSEIPSGERLRLGPGTEVTLLDYARCKMITVRGGTVRVTRFDFYADGRILTATKAPCPRIHKLRASGSGSAAGGLYRHMQPSGATTGGLLMRGLTGTPRWPLNRELVFAGNGSDAVTGAAIYASGKLDTPLVRLELRGRRARYPAGSAALAENGRYVLRLTMAGRAAPEDIPFIGRAATGPSLLVVLRR